MTKKARQKGSAAETGAKVFGGVTMYPFVFGERWIDHAVMLAKAASTYESEEQNAAVIELVTGLAAIPSLDDRLQVAYFVAEEIFKRTPASARAHNEFVRKYRDEFLMEGL